MPTFARAPVNDTSLSAADKTPPLRRLAQFVVRRRWWVIAGWLLVTAALAPFARRVQRDFEVAAKVRGSEAAAVDSAMATTFASPFAQYAVLVAAGVPSPDMPQGRAMLDSIIAAVDTITGVTGTLSYLTARDTLFRGPNGGTLVIVGLDASTQEPDAMIPRLRLATSDLGRSIGHAYPQATLRWTGSAPINFDIRSSSAAEARAAELRVLPLTLLLLLLAFGALTASLLPIAAAGLAIVTALGIAALVNTVWPLSILLQNIASMIGLGVGIDYALLTLSRFREARWAGLDAQHAAIEASYHAGGTIALSGAAVCIGFGALLLVPLNELQSIGVGGVLVVGTSVLVAVSFLPALLAVLGQRVDAGRLGRGAAGSPLQAWWRAWGRRVVAHPVLVFVVAAIPLVALAWQATRLDASLPRGNWLPRGIESGLAIGDLSRMQRGGVVNSVRVLVELPRDADLFTRRGWAAVQRLTALVASDPRVARVGSITTAIPVDSLSLLAFSLLPERARQTLMSPDARATVIEAIPRDALEFNVITALVRDLRKADVVRAAGLEGIRVRVGGIPALNADYEDAINSRFARIIALVIGLTLVALMIGFRSVLIPIKAVALNLLSVAAAYGAVVLVFQDGHGATMIGLDAPLNGVFPAVPILVFCIVFGLSMDYEVFLVSRVAEARRRLDEREAVVEGLERTGGVITSAAAIMIAVFGAFALGKFVFIKILGFALAVAVLVDATIVRMALGPALLVLAGRWNWWPGRRR